MTNRGYYRASAAACLLTLCMPSVRAFACDLASPPALVIEANPSDQTPPSSPTASIRTVNRGEGSGGCGDSTGSCDDLGVFIIHVESTDNASPASELGYVFEAEANSRLAFLGSPLLPDASGNVRLVRTGDDGRDDLQITLRVFAVDKAGNMSDAPTELRLRDDGGCRLAGGGSQGMAWTAAGLLALIWRRRRLGVRHDA